MTAPTKNAALEPQQIVAALQAIADEPPGAGLFEPDRPNEWTIPLNHRNQRRFFSLRRDGDQLLLVSDGAEFVTVPVHADQAIRHLCQQLGAGLETPVPGVVCHVPLCNAEQQRAFKEQAERTVAEAKSRSLGPFFGKAWVDEAVAVRSGPKWFVGLGRSAIALHRRARWDGSSRVAVQRLVTQKVGSLRTTVYLIK